MKNRQLSQHIFDDLKSGCLHPFVDAVLNDNTLDIEFRGDSFNIYYRGGSLFKVSLSANGYAVSFDENYDISKSGNICGSPIISDAIKNIPVYKQTMDRWFSQNPKLERECQQLIVRENNASSIANSTDYFMADMEYTCNDDISGRFDIIGIKWLSKGSERKNVNKPVLSLIELKYGDGALKNDAGIKKHLDDFEAFIKDQKKIDDLCKDMSVVFRQKCELGLISCLKDSQFNICISPRDIEVMFIFANHDPESKILANELQNISQSNYDFPVRVAVSSIMGYGVYKTVGIDEFKSML